MGFSTDQCLSLWEFTYSLRWYTVSLLNRTSMELISSTCVTWRYQFPKLNFVSQSAWESVWTTVVVQGWQFSSFLSFCNDDADTQACCANCTKDFLEMPAVEHPVCSFGSEHVFCVFSLGLKLNLLAVDSVITGHMYGL